MRLPWIISHVRLPFLSAAEISIKHSALYNNVKYPLMWINLDRASLKQPKWRFGSKFWVPRWGKASFGTKGEKPIVKVIWLHPIRTLDLEYQDGGEWLKIWWAGLLRYATRVYSCLWKYPCRSLSLPWILVVREKSMTVSSVLICLFLH